MAVTVPKELLNEAGAKEGVMVKLSLAIPTTSRDAALEGIAGLDAGKRAFWREKRDRY